jgi:hypothetical protein
MRLGRPIPKAPLDEKPMAPVVGRAGAQGRGLLSRGRTRDPQSSPLEPAMRASSSAHDPLPGRTSGRGSGRYELICIGRRRLRGRRGGRGPCGAGLHGAHTRLPQEGVPLLLCAVEGVLVDFAADARDSAVGLILPEMPGARAVLYGRMVFGERTQIG